MKNLQNIFSNFEIVLEESIDKTWSVEGPIKHIEALAQNAQALSEKMIAIGDEQYSLLQNDPSQIPAELFEHYFTCFVWSEASKSFLILWRNLLFQSQKAYFLKMDGQVAAEKIITFNQQSKEVVEAAVKDLKNLPTDELDKLVIRKRGIEKSIRDWKLQQNPWPVYRDQMNKLAAQCLELMVHFQEMKKVFGVFQDIRKTINQNVKSCNEGISSFKNTGDQAIEIIKKDINPEIEIRLGRLITKLEDIEEGLQFQDYGKIFNDSLNKELESLTRKTQVPLSIEEGNIYLQEINFYKAVKQWLESEIMPLFYEIWESTENVQNNLKMSLVNIQNRLAVLSTELKEKKELDLSSEETGQFLESFFNNAKEAEENANYLEKTIKIRLNSDFKLTRIYKSDDSFLALPLQSTVNRFKLSNIRLFDKGKNWLASKVGIIRRFQKSVEAEESLSNSEKIIRFVKSRKPDVENIQYSNIFLTKGYIGESFWIGRENEINHIDKIVKNWKLGFRGAVAITGRRLSGKSLFGYFVANHFFRNHIVKLSPNSIITVSGRRMNTTYNLEEALSFIKKHSINQHSLIWIDDLELWSHPQYSLGQNVQKLLKYMDDNSSNLFFLVAMSNWFKTYLNRFFGIKKAFQAELNMDKMSFENVHEAILIRHGATHKKMVVAEGQEMPPNQFRKIIKKTCQLAEGNIGDALNYWTTATKKLNENEVIHEAIPGYFLPDFIDPNTGILLTLIMREKKTNEYKLRKLFGPAYNDTYSTILQRLIGLGLINRLPGGMLEVNELVANDIGQALEEKNFFQFHNLL